MSRLLLRPVTDAGALAPAIGSATLGDDDMIVCEGSPVLGELVAAIVARFRCDEKTAFRRLVADGWSNGKLALGQAGQEEGTMGARVDLGRLHNLAEMARERMIKAAGGPVNTPRDALGRSWYRIENAAPGAAADAPASVYLYDMIGEWGVTAQDFVNDLRGVSAGVIDLHVNCEGGEVFDGLAIYETLRARRDSGTVINGHIDGIAASSASFIVQACSKITMAKRGRMMIHNAHGICMGNEYDMEEMAALLRDLSENIADIYAERAGGTREQWRAAMRAASGGPDGTWLDAPAAVRAGLADAVQGEEGAPAVARVIVPEPEVADWNPQTLLAVFDEISNPPAPVRIPDGQALLNALKTT